jgi:hypothetical protein
MRVLPPVSAVINRLRVGIDGRTACARPAGMNSTVRHQRNHASPFTHLRAGAETAMRAEDGGYTPPVSGQVTIFHCRELTMAKDQLAEIQQELNEIHARMAHKSATDPLHMLTLTIQFFLLLHEEGEIRRRELALRLTVLEHAVQGLAQRMAADPWTIA